MVEAEGLHAFPAFFDPHVHLRTPGREDEEDIETGTRAAAAGGYCGILAMANTEPHGLRRRRRRRAARARPERGLGPGRLPRHGHPGHAGRGADRDGGAARRRRDRLLRRRAADPQRPGPAPGASVPAPLRRRDRPARGGPRALRRAASCTRARSRRRSGLAGIPSISESTMIARDAALAGYEEARIHVQHLSAASRSRRSRAAKAGRRADQLRGDAAPPLPHRRGGPQPRRHRFKMNPPLRAEDDRQALIEGLRDGHDRLHRHRPRAALADEKEVPFEAAAMGVTGLETAFAVLHTELVLPGRARPRAAGREARRRRGALRPRAAEPRRRAARPTSPSATWGPSGRSARTATRAARPTAGSRGRQLRGRVLMTVAAGQVAYRLRSFAWGWPRREARPRAGGAGRRRRPGGVPQGGPGLRARSPSAAAKLVQGATAMGVPIVVTEQYPQGLGGTVPEVAEHLPRGSRADREGPLLRRRGRGLRPRRPRPGAGLRDRDPRLRQPDRPRPARRRSRGARGRRRGRLAHRGRTASSACTGPSGPARC